MLFEVKIKKFSILIFSFFAILSCSSENLIQIGLLHNIQIYGIENKTILCHADLEIDNRFFLPFKIETGELKVNLSQKVIGNIKLMKPIHIKALRCKKYKVDFMIEITDTHLGILSLVQHFVGQNIDCRVKGRLYMHSLITARDISIDMPLYTK